MPRADLELANSGDRGADASGVTTRPDGIRRPGWASTRLPWLVLGAVLVLTPPVVGFLYIQWYGVNMIQNEQLLFLFMMDRFYDGRLSWIDVFARYRGQIHAVPYTYLLQLSRLTHWNTIAEMYSSWGVLCLTTLVLFTLWKSAATSIRPRRDALAAVSFVPVVWLVFNLRQTDVFLWGMQIASVMANLFVLVALACLVRGLHSVRWTIAGAVAGVLASLSFASGLMAWPAGIILLGYVRPSRSDWRKTNARLGMVVWLASALAMFIIFLSHGDTSASPAALDYLLREPQLVFTFLVTLLGAPLRLDVDTAWAAGLILMVLYTVAAAWLVKNRLRPAEQPSPQAFMPGAIVLALLTYGVLSAAAVAVGRTELGAAVATVDRYTSVTALAIVGLWLWTTMLPYGPPHARVAVGTLVAGLIVLGLVTGYRYGFTIGEGRRSSRLGEAYLISTQRLQADGRLERVFGTAAVNVRQVARMLEKHQLGVFAPGDSLDPRSLRRVGVTSAGRFDPLDGRIGTTSRPVVIQSTRQDSIQLSGWALDPVTRQPARAVYIALDNGIDVPTLYGERRKDFGRGPGGSDQRSGRARKDDVAYFNAEAYRFAGYSASFATHLLPIGQHTLSMKIVGANGQAYHDAESTLVVDIR